MDKQNKLVPYNDNTMIYDYNMHRYILTVKGVLTELGEDLKEILNASGDANPSTLAYRFLCRVSQTVYAYIYRYSQGEQWLEYILAKYSPLRSWIKEMLQAQTLYMLANGDIGLYSGVNIGRDQAMEIEAVRGRARIAPEVEDIAQRTIPGLGYCLKYAGALPCVCADELYKGY